MNGSYSTVRPAQAELDAAHVNELLLSELLSSLEMSDPKVYDPQDEPASVQGYLAHKKHPPSRTLQ